MAQTTGAIGGACYDIEVSSDGSSWVDISGTSNNVSEIAQGRKIGEAYTAAGDTAVLTSGKREPVDIEFRILYTEGNSEAFETVRPLFEADCGDPIWVRWAPKGIGASGNFVWNVLNAPISQFKYGALDAGAAGPVMAGFTVKAPKVVKTTTASSTGLGSA